MNGVGEAGHALIASLTPEADKVHKVTIVPRGRALGYTMQLPTHDRFLLSQHELETRLTILLGGRPAETIVFGEAPTGADDDLSHATDLARRMVTEFGMSAVLGPVRLAAEMQANYLSQQFGLDARVSQETATLVDVETRRILEEAVEDATIILKDHRLALDSLADLLCEHETVDGAQIDALLGLEEKREAGIEFLKPTPNGHQPIKKSALIKDDGWQKAKVELLGDLLRWEYEGGLTAARLNELEPEE